MSSPTTTPSRTGKIEVNDAVMKKISRYCEASFPQIIWQRYGIGILLRERKTIRQTKADKEMKMIFEEEYKLNHSGFLLLSRADSIVKNTNAHQGRDKNNLNDLMLVLLFSIIF